MDFSLSMPILYTAVLSLTFFFYFRLISSGRKQKQGENLPPPEPFGLPLLGHLLFLGKDPSHIFYKWKKKYGNVFSIFVAGKRIVVLNDLKTTTKFLSHEEINSHFSIKLFEKYCQLRGGTGINNSDGKTWQEQRLFVIKSLAEFGTRDKKIEEQLTLEAKRLTEDLAALKGRAVPLSKLLPRYTVNATWRAIGNGTLEDHETEILINAIQAHTQFGSVTEFFSILFIPFFEKYTSVLEWRWKAFEQCRQTLEEKFKKHALSRIPGQPRDVIDKYQDVVDETTDPESSFHPSRSQMVPTIMDVLFGSMDTTALTMEWLIIYLLRNPEIQTKMQQEMDTVVGKDRLPLLEDRINMPYTEACILEILRIRPIVPFGIPKQVTEDVSVQGFLIPKNSLVMANTRGMHHDPETWDQPDMFLPERFIDSDGFVKKGAKKMINTFSTGKRSCPGERIAHNTMFLFLTSILHSFNIKSEDRWPSIQYSFGLISAPAATIHVSFELRN